MTKKRLLYKERIAVDPETMVGKPVVKGTRIPVERVVAHLAHNPDLNDLFGAYPELTVEDVKACLHYAYAAVEENAIENVVRLDIFLLSREVSPGPKHRRPSSTLPQST